MIPYEKACFDYFGIQLYVEHSDITELHIPVGRVMLTQIGCELAPISGASKNDEFFEYVLSEMQKSSINLYSKIN